MCGRGRRGSLVSMDLTQIMITALSVLGIIIVGLLAIVPSMVDGSARHRPRS